MNPAHPPGEPIAPALDRSGHLSELSLDRYVYDPRDEDFCAAVEVHLDACPDCRRVLEALKSEDASFELSAPSNIIRFPSKSKNETSAIKVVPIRKRSTLSIALPVFLAAALALIVAWPRPPAEGPGEDTYRVKGTPFELEVHVHDGQTSRLVADGDLVHPGERVGFRVRSKTAGHLLILGHDDRDNVYLCYPQGTTATAVPLDAHLEMVPLEAAMQFDDVLGAEHLTAYFCDSPLSLPTLDPKALETPPGCTRRELTLKKVPMTPPDGGPR